ncbi:MAG: hypothetical protein UH084_08080 [Paludibacteraceae bacterium]|nr:hypothetical protein [Paludibacteraceae bacterium]
MKREDQITQAAMDYCREYKTSKLTAENMALLAFSDGARWADENPKQPTLAQVLDNAKRQEQAVIEAAQKARKVHPIIRNTLIILAFIALFFAVLYLIPSFAYLSFNFLTWDAAIRAAIGLISLFGGIISGFFVIIELDDNFFTGKGMRCPAG